MKVFSFFLFIFLCINGISQSVIPQKGTGSKFSLTCANLYFEIDSARGARISSFKLNDSELLYIDFKKTDMAGSTFWPSPQSVWGWPPAVNLDSKPYKTSIKLNKITFTGNTDTNSKVPSMLRFYKTISANTTDTSIIIDYCMKNEKASAQKWAPWEVTRVLNSGLTVFSIGDGEVTGNMAGRTEVQSDYVWYEQDGSGSGDKFFCDGKGWLAHVVDGDMLFIKKFDDIASGNAAPGEAEVEVYTMGDKSYTELENQGAYASIASKDSVTWRVKWYARKLPASVDVSVGSASLTSYIESVLKRETVSSKLAVKNNFSPIIYPNPVANMLTIETDPTISNTTTMRIIDLQGKVVLTHSIQRSTDQINVEKLPQGNYLYDIKQGTITLSKGHIAIKH